jgi:PTS system glucose-specific IIA component
MSKITIKSPVSGTIIPLDQVEDNVFSSKMMGDGCAIDPSSEWFVAPCDGEITAIFPTKHAVGITTPEGLEILLHIGLDTVELHGIGFKAAIKEGDMVTTGQRLIKIKKKKINKLGKSVITPLIITNMDMVQSMTCSTGEIEAGAPLIEVVL